MKRDGGRGTGTAGPDGGDEVPTDLDFTPTAGSDGLRNGLASFFHDRRRIGSVFLLGLLLTALAAAMAPTKYTSSAELLLRLGREYIYKPELGAASGNSPVAYDREETLLAESRILTSRDLMESVLDRMGNTTVFPQLEGSPAKRWLRDTALPAVGLARLWPAPGAADATAQQRQRSSALAQFDRALHAELLKGSNLLQVGFDSSSPQIAAAVLTEVVASYLKRRSEIFASGMEQPAQANFELRKSQLQDAEAKLAKLKRDRNIQAFGAEQSLLLAQRNGLEERRAESQVSLARASARAASLRTSLSSVAADVQLGSETQRSEAVEKARSLLLDLKLKERDLTSQFKDDSPAVQDVRADIARTNSYLRELLAHPVRTVRTGRSPSRDAVEADLLRTLADQQQARSATQVLATERESTERRLAELSASEAEFNALERDRRIAEGNYDVAAKALRDEVALAELDKERRSNVSIVQAPRVPVHGTSYAPVIVIVGVFVSLCAALLTAFLSALWRDTFLTPEEVERTLGLPFLVAVPRDLA